MHLILKQVLLGSHQLLAKEQRLFNVVDIALHSVSNAEEQPKLHIKSCKFSSDQKKAIQSSFNSLADFDTCKQVFNHDVKGTNEVIAKNKICGFVQIISIITIVSVVVIMVIIMIYYKGKKDEQPLNIIDESII